MFMHIIKGRTALHVKLCITKFQGNNNPRVKLKCFFNHNSIFIMKDYNKQARYSKWEIKHSTKRPSGKHDA